MNQSLPPIYILYTNIVYYMLVIYMFCFPGEPQLIHISFESSVKIIAKTLSICYVTSDIYGEG